MLMQMTDVQPLLRVPTCPGSADQAEIYVQGDLPVLVDFDSSVLEREKIMLEQGSSRVRRRAENGNSRIKRLLSPSKRVTHDNIANLIGLLRAQTAAPRVLVIGGGTVGQGMGALYDAADIQVIAFDLYASPMIHFIADAHDIPLDAGVVDGVIVQAVLEHVLDPKKVVAEIWRVLKTGGIVYSETPFLQHVHEGAYDFTRFTESGHRYLFRQFELIRSGVCGGPGTQLMWSIDYFVRSLFRSWTAGKLAKFACLWLQWFDRLIPESYGSDAASGCYFLGRRSTVTLSSHQAVGFYRGAQNPA